MKDADATSVDNTYVTAGNRSDLADIATRMGVTPGLALEIAINRLHVAFFSKPEGDLVDVDFSKSLPAQALGPGAISVSLPGCEGV
jgi:hypothetical protein